MVLTCGGSGGSSALSDAAVGKCTVRPLLFATSSGENSAVSGRIPMPRGWLVPVDAAVDAAVVRSTLGIGFITGSGGDISSIPAFSVRAGGGSVACFAGCFSAASAGGGRSDLLIGTTAGSAD